MKLKMVALSAVAVFLQLSLAFGQITIDPPTRTFAKEGGGASILTAGSGTWTASTTASWITITPRTNGAAGESCTYVVDANLSADTRQGTISIAGLTHIVTQTGYDATLTPSSATFGIAGGTGTISVAVAAGVSWTAATTTSWLTVHTTSGIGNGSVLYSVAAYGGVVTRVGTLRVGAKTFTVTQTGTDVNINPSAVDKAYSSDIILVNVSALVGTLWTVVPNNPWITVVDAGNGFGDSVITLAIGTNLSYAPRVGTVSIGSATFTIRQDGVRNPSLDITPYASTANPNGALGNIAVSATPDSPWNSQSQNGWIIIASGTTGSGNGNINYVVSANPTITTRVGTITVNGPPPNFDSRDFSRGALHIFSNRVDFARNDISIVGGNNYPDFTGTERATLNGYGIKDTHDWAIALRFRHNSDGAIHRLLYYAEGGRTLAIWVDADLKLKVRSDAETFTVDTLNFTAGTNYFVLAQGTTNTLDIYACEQGTTPIRRLQLARSTSVLPPNANLLNLQVGGSEFPSSGNYIGNLNLLSIHNRQLTAAEIENYNQAAPWNDAASSFASPMFVTRGSTTITPTRALLMRGNLRDQMGLGKASLMSGTNPNFSFKTTTDRFGTAGSALDINNGTDCRLTLGSNVFRTLSFWFKATNTSGRTLMVMRSTRPDNVTHSYTYRTNLSSACNGPWYTKNLSKTTSGNPDYYIIQLYPNGNLAINSQRLTHSPLTNFWDTSGRCTKDFNWTSPTTYGDLGTYTVSNKPSAGIWHHLAISVTGTGVIKLFLNGQEVGNTATFSGNLAGYTFNWLGNDYSNTGETIVDPSPGTLDDLAIYTQELTPAEITTLYNQQKSIQRVHTVTQGALPVSLAPAQSTIIASGGTADLTLTIGGNVSWTASTGAGWLSISTNAGAGQATIRVEAGANTTVYTRATTVTAGGQTVSVSQGGLWASVSTNRVTLPPDGGSVFFDVSAEGGAWWQAVSLTNWLTVTLGASGTGNGSVMVVCDPYNEYSRARIGTVEIAGHTVYVSQCGYSLTVNPTAVEIGSNAGAGELAIVAPLDAVWEAIATASWITLVGGNNGIGSGSLHYSVAANTTGEIRTGRIIISGVEYTIVQGINPTDNDEDGMPNEWELLYGFNINDPDDADDDPDEDGLSNLQEYQIGTNPLLRDTSGDGVDDGTAYALRSLGFSPTNDSSSLAQQIQDNSAGLGIPSADSVLNDPNAYGLFTSNQMHGLALGDLVIDRNPANNRFRVGFGLHTSSNMFDWLPMPDDNITVSVSNGLINTEVTTDTNAWFFRVRSGTQP
ncbi:MAG: hypothetical protein KBC66_09510 [Kiritimatiellae bacterium]|nr:hypothetical protein [Kiritimatiellia bacterium]